MRKIKKKVNFLFVAFLSLALLTGCRCVSSDEPDFNNDPFEPMNRAVFSFNEVMDRTVFKPVAKGYRLGVPSFFREMISNVFSTLKQPAYLMNSLLQGEFKSAGWVLVRTSINLTFGFFGLFDVATDMDIPAPDNDFGQTMAKWGWTEGGPYLMLPVLGPSNPRDAIGLGVDALTDIAQWRLRGEYGVIAGAVVVNGLSKREKGLELLDNVQNSSTDYYATLRTMYQQNRRKKINVGKFDDPAITTEDFDFEIEE